MGLLNGHGEFYFLQDISLPSQNCPKTCGFTHWWFQHILEIVVIIKTQKSFTSSKPNLNKMHVFGTTCFCYVQNEKKLDPHCEKGIFVSYDKQSPAYMIHFLETKAIKRVRCVKFTDSYDNCLLLKLDKNTEFPEYLITYDVQRKDNLNSEGEGQISCYPMWQRKKPSVFVVKNFEFGRVDYCCNLRTIPSNYAEAINSVNSNNWILAMKGEFDSILENTTFEWQKAPRNKNIVVSWWFFTIKSKSDGSHDVKRDLWPRTTRKYTVKIIEKLLPQQQIWLP